MTTRKRRAWKSGTSVPVPEPAPADDDVGRPQFEHSSFTFEGEIERLGTIVRNRSSAPRWARIVAEVVALAILVPFAVGLVFFLVDFLR